MIGKTMIALAVVAAGALAMVAVDTIPADARAGGGGGGARGGGGGGGVSRGGGGSVSRGGGGGGRVVFSPARSFAPSRGVAHRSVRYAPTRIYSDGYGYGGGCEALHQRALVTGSRYWWNRYYACRGY